MCKDHLQPLIFFKLRTKNLRKPPLNLFPALDPNPYQIKYCSKFETRLRPLLKFIKVDKPLTFLLVKFFLLDLNLSIGLLHTKWSFYSNWDNKLRAGDVLKCIERTLFLIWWVLLISRKKMSTHSSIWTFGEWFLNAWKC